VLCHEKPRDRIHKISVTVNGTATERAPARDRRFADSPLEGSGFELLVPHGRKWGGYFGFCRIFVREASVLPWVAHQRLAEVS
jgi:hypothetical protein